MSYSTELVKAERLEVGDVLPGLGVVVALWFDAAGVAVTFAGDKRQRFDRSKLLYVSQDDDTMPACLMCGNPPDYCPGGHGWACDECDGYRDGHAEGCSRAPEAASGVVEALTATINPDLWDYANDDAERLTRALGDVETDDPLGMAINLPDDELRTALAWLHVLAERASR